jgi:hypothetical protein
MEAGTHSIHFPACAVRYVALGKDVQSRGMQLPALPLEIDAIEKGLADADV